MAVVEDFRVVKQTIVGIRVGQGLVGAECDIIVVDNRPGSPSSSELREFCRSVSARYVPMPDPVGTSAPRDMIFRLSRTDVTCVIDPHVVLYNNTLRHLAEYTERHPKEFGLILGCMMSDGGSVSASHMRPEWGGDLMYGVFDVKTAEELNAVAVSVPMQGLAFVACRTGGWIDSPEGLSGFSCDEWPIAQQFRAAGRHVILLPQLRWWHNFWSQNSPSTSHATLEDRFRNYAIWGRRVDLGWSEEDLIARFSPAIGDNAIQRALSSIGVVRPLDPTLAGSKLPVDRSKTAPQLPSLAKMAINYGSALVKHTANGRPVVSPEVYNDRLSICASCPSLIPQEVRCSQCGCFMEEAALWAEKECPNDPPKWPALLHRSKAGDGGEPACEHRSVECPSVSVDAQVSLMKTPSGKVVGKSRQHKITTTCRCKDCGVEFPPAVAVVKPVFKPKES